MHPSWQTFSCQSFRHALTTASSMGGQAPWRSWAGDACRSRIQTSLFSTSPVMMKRKKKNPLDQTDPRITLIRYFLFKHAKNPRPLRFSRHRYLRHWTIHRAWMLYKRKTRAAAQQDLERQYWAMNRACEELRLIGEDGMPGGKDEGRLFRIAMRKEGVWQGAPIEYARMQTEWPSRDGWDHDWKRS